MLVSGRVDDGFDVISFGQPSFKKNNRLGGLGETSRHQQTYSESQSPTLGIVGCPRKLGSMVSKWVSYSYNLLINGVFLGVK